MSVANMIESMAKDAKAASRRLRQVERAQKEVEPPIMAEVIAPRGDDTDTES